MLAQRRTKSEEFFATSAGRWDALRTELFGRGADLHALLGLLDDCAGELDRSVHLHDSRGDLPLLEKLLHDARIGSRDACPFERRDAVPQHILGRREFQRAASEAELRHHFEARLRLAQLELAQDIAAYDAALGSVVPLWAMIETCGAVLALAEIAAMRPKYLTREEVPAETVEYSTSPTTYATTNTLTDLEGTGVECPRFVDYADRLLAYMTAHPEIGSEAMA